MKRCFALVFAASLLCLAGCATVSHTTKWEYKMEDTRQWAPSAGSTQDWQATCTSHLNDLGKEGWVFMHKDGATIYFMRPAK